LAESLRVGDPPKRVSVTVRVFEHARNDDTQLWVDRSIPFDIVRH